MNGVSQLAADSSDDVASLTARARLATAQARWTEAARLWADLHAATPVHRDLSVKFERTPASDGRKTAAPHPRAVRAARTEMFELAVADADMATRRQDWQQAEVLWRAMVQRFPGQLRCVLGLADALARLNRFEQAETLLATALLADPDARSAAEALARVSASRGDWSEAYRRWSAIARRFPTSIAAWHGVAYASLQLGDLAEAESLSSQAVALFPNERAVLIVHAIAAANAFDWPEAERRWDRVRRVAPNSADVWIQQARALRAQGLDQAASDLLAEAPDFAGNVPLARMRAELATACGHWADACVHWQALHESAPDDRRLQEGAFLAAWRAAGLVQVPPAARSLARAAGDPDRDLMLRFEGLGNDREFGLVQRHFRAEPLGLFRWADSATDRLVTALDASLAGVGDSENTRLVLGGDYKVRDRRFGLSMHTWVTEDKADRGQFFDEQCRRLRFLRRNLLDDFQEADKIFVYKGADAEPMEDIRRLHSAIRRHGPSTLLYVRVADSAHPVGAVEQADDGLLVGYLDRFCREGTPISYDVWFTLCRNALVTAGCLDNSAAHALPVRDVVLRFESVGSNCEFGCVQRYAKAEPIGLLRWTATTLKSITQAIESGLSGIGDPANTELFTGGTYRALDMKYGFGMETFLGGEHGSAVDLLAEQCQRMRFLGRQLLGDLAAGTKIFVHKTAKPASFEEVTALHAAMHRHGPATLLHVRPLEPGHSDGTVRQLAPGLLVGYIDRVTAAGSGWGIDHETWLEVCRKAAALHDK